MVVDRGGAALDVISFPPFPPSLSLSLRKAPPCYQAVITEVGLERE